MNRKEMLYNLFMKLIGCLKNDEILKLANSLIEYVNNDKEELK